MDDICVFSDFENISPMGSFWTTTVFTRSRLNVNSVDVYRSVHAHPNNYHWSQTPYFGAVYALNSSFPLGVDKVLKVATSAYTIPGSKEYINIYVYIDGNVVSTMAFRTRPLASHLRYDHHEALFLEFVLHCLVACGVHPDQLSLRFPGWKG